jgi:hypothetical protein
MTRPHCGAAYPPMSCLSDVPQKARLSLFISRPGHSFRCGEPGASSTDVTSVGHRFEMDVTETTARLVRAAPRGEALSEFR